MISVVLAAALAKAVWPLGHETELNSHFAFVAEFECGEMVPVLEVVAPYPYKAYLNGEFVGWGPARAAKGFYRPDVWSLAKAVRGRNELRIEEAAYNQGACYCNPDNPAFILAEVRDGKAVLAATGRDFRAFGVPRVRNVSRYSYQRTFNECWRIGDDSSAEAQLAERQVDMRLLPRRVAYPDFSFAGPFAKIKEYAVRYNGEKKVETIDFIEGSAPGCPEYYNGCRIFPKAELAVNLWDEMQRLDRDTDPADGFSPTRGKATVFDLGVLRTGFLGFSVKCSRPGRLYALFDEVVDANGDVDPTRCHVANAVRWDIVNAGEYSLETFEPYAFRAVRFVMLGGEAEIVAPYVRQVRSPSADAKMFACDDRELRDIFEAARETFAENAVDVFTDCPGRERSGWLCDSFFTARASQFFTGSTALEKIFLENFLMAKDFGPQPNGIFPSNYPAELPNGRFIPNWSFWFVLELREYLARSGDLELVEAFRPKVMKLVDFFSKYENADGLLEKLPGWIFVEWSHANKLVQDVNYPSNMTYAKVLEDVAEMYGCDDLLAKAGKIRAEILKQSWNGEWFCDNAVRGPDGALRATGERTEVCQYYAFFFNVATPETHPTLWKRLVDDFGPQRKAIGKWPEIHPANAFIGDYLRLDLLSRHGYGDQVIREIRGYFLKMAKTTGTLWEHDLPKASCCHGFASYVAPLLSRHAPPPTPFPQVGEARAITTGPKEHFLASYFAINAWSDDNRHVLALETDFTGRLPHEGERCTIGVVDLADGDRFIPVSTTACWNFQEAAMGHWLDNDTILFNDVRDGKFVAVVMDWRTKRELQILPHPVSAVSEDRTWAVSINYARLYLTRPDYGYAGAGQNPRADVTWPADDGLWTMDLKTGESKLVLSVAQGRALMPPVAQIDGKPGNPLAYYCHTVISKDGRKIFFLARSVDWFDAVNHTAAKHHTTSFTVNRDGSDLRRCFPDGWGGSHFNWAPDGSHRLLVTTPIPGNRWPSLVEFEVGQEAACRRIGAGVLDQDWHCVYSPDGEFMSGEAYPNGNDDRCWQLVRLSDGLAMPLGAFRVPSAYRNAYWRCDLHARWRKDGRQLGFNSVHEGSRQIYLRDVIWKGK